VPTSGEIRGVDPYCPAYKKAFDEITNRVNEEMFGSSDMDMFQPISMSPSRSGIMSIMLKKI
jgi:uncharacterized protein